MDRNFSERIMRCLKRMLKDVPFVVKETKKTAKKIGF